MNPFALLATAHAAGKEETLKTAVSNAAKNKDKIEKQIAELQVKLEQAKQKLSDASRAFNEWQAENNTPPVTTTEAGGEAAPVVTVVSTETDDERIARIVTETLINLGVTSQIDKKDVHASSPSAPHMQVKKSAEELTLSPAPVAGPTGAKGGNYPAAKQHKQRH